MYSFEGVFGMNIQNHFESEPHFFTIVCGLLSITVLGTFRGLTRYARHLKIY